LAVDWGLADIVKKDLSPEEMIKELENTEKGRTLSKEIERSKKWFYYRTGKGGAMPITIRRPGLKIFPCPSGISEILWKRSNAAKTLKDRRKTTSRSEIGLRKSYLSMLKTEDDKNMFRLLLDRVRTAYIYVEDHMWYC